MKLKLLLTGAVAVSVLSASLSAQAVAKMDEPLPTKPFARLSASAHSVRDSIVSLARRQLGTPYKLGAKAPGRAFDCSGLVQYVMEAFNIELPRTSREQAQIGEPLPRDLTALKPGDLLTFGKGKRISHVGIYVGDGKYVHAATRGREVKETKLTEQGSWWKGARRIIASTDSASPNKSKL